MPTEIHKHAARMVWTGHSTIEIVTELQNRFDILGDEKERELFIRVGQLRAQITEARNLAPTLAAQMFRDGHDWKEVKDVLMRPFLLSGFEVDGIISRAQAVVKAEQQEA